MAEDRGPWLGDGRGMVGDEDGAFLLSSLSLSCSWRQKQKERREKEQSHSLPTNLTKVAFDLMFSSP